MTPRWLVLERAVRQALAGGYDHLGLRLATGAGSPLLRWSEENWTELLENDAYFTTVFDHDFAKALWGDERVPVYGNSAPFDDEVTNREIAWQYHLQQMVIADDPISYLTEHLPEADRA